MKMRRRSERKKSTDVASPAPASRRTNRRRKSHSASEEDKTIESSNDLKIGTPLEDNIEQSSGEMGRDSSEERSEGKRRRSSRVRTPVKEPRASPSKRRTRRETTPDKKINTIIEEENGTVISGNEFNTDDVGNQYSIKEDENSKLDKNNENETLEEAQQKANKKEGEESKREVLYNKNKGPAIEKFEENIHINSVDNEIQKIVESSSLIKNENNEIVDKEDQDEVKLYTRDNSPQSRSNSSDRKDQCQFAEPTTRANEDNDDELEEGEVVENVSKSDEEKNAKIEVRERFLKRHSIEGSMAAKDERKDHHKLEEVNNTQDGKTNVSSNTTAAADTGRINVIPNTTRKRRWITKKATESKEQILAISTDSLKTLIADVHPVPLSDVQLESSSEVEELASEREEGQQSPSPEPERRRSSTEKSERSSKLLSKSSKENNRHINQVVLGVGAVHASIQRPPSPARNQSSNVLFITNLVRPFTVLQLKGLLARTGNIVENGFWIDHIKSKCYVEYENEDHAVETRHALHGVRWPISNPKCLNVDFGSKKDMLNAIESTKEETPKFGQETNKDNLLVGSGWSRERHEDEKKGSRPVREWDVGKKENLEREKVNRDVDRRRERSRDRSLDRNRERNSRDRNMSRNRENERIDRGERDRRQRRERDIRSNSLSPARKHKKKEDPPLRLLDDLFRKTKATPCIYWLPLTPEQIAEKEAFRQKRLEEQKQRLKQRELEREKDREKERNRHSDRDRERDHRHSNRSSDRRRSRSRDRRRY